MQARTRPLLPGTLARTSSCHAHSLVSSGLAIRERTCTLLHVHITVRCLSAENDLRIARGIRELLLRPLLGPGVVLDPLRGVVIASLLVDPVPCLLSHSVPNFGVEPFTLLEQEIRVSGSGDLNARDLTSQRARINISGSGDAMARVEREIEGRISGSGSIVYSGAPSVAVRTSGSGRAIRMPV